MAITKNVLVIEFEVNDDPAIETIPGFLNLGDDDSYTKEVEADIERFRDAPETNTADWFVGEIANGNIPPARLIGYAIAGFTAPIRAIQERRSRLMMDGGLMQMMREVFGKDDE